MKKTLLIKYISKETTTQENLVVEKWLSESEINFKYFGKLRDTVIATDMSLLSTDDRFVSNGEKDEILGRILNDDATTAKRNTYFSSNGHFKAVRAFLLVAAIVCLIFSILFNLYQHKIIKTNYPDTYTAKYNNERVYKSFYTVNGVKGKITLPDGSVVWMNSASSISFPYIFSDTLREVNFQGEGYFDIQTNPDRPMIVTTEKGMRIKVMGTTFHVSSYTDDDKEEITLFSGKVNLSNKSSKIEQMELKPYQTVQLSYGKKLINVTQTTEVDTIKKVSWKDGDLIYDQTPMKDVIKSLERWHGVEIKVLDNDVYNYYFTANFHSESIIQILELLEFTSPIKYEIEDKIIYLSKRN
jgi:transmembrane sensor